MQTVENNTAPAKATGCSYSQQKTGRAFEPRGKAIEQDEKGVWQIRGYEEARFVLRQAETVQAGFAAETIAKVPRIFNAPILYLEGKPHNEQRKKTARFFTPKAVSENYRPLLEKLSDEMIAELGRKGEADLSSLSLKLATRVAGAVVGLTNSHLPGMAQRLENFFDAPVGNPDENLLVRIAHRIQQLNVLLFFYLDVKPAIAARRKRSQEDVISHLLTQNYNDFEILSECITYAAAGMVTTREFISVATWHMLEQPELRQRYLAAEEPERHDLLHEILRLEPVVGNLYRRATEDITVPGATPVIIKKGDTINIQIMTANSDPAVAGEHPQAVCPARPLAGDRTPTMLLGFGDGAHRCPGAYLAMHEADIFLQKLVRLPTLRIIQKPTVSWNDLIAGYEIRRFLLAV
jgi:cytochrome P450